MLWCSIHSLGSGAVPCRHGVPAPVCRAPHHSLLCHTHQIHPFTLHGPCGKLRLEVQADILRLGKEYMQRTESGVYQAVCLCMHLDVVQVRGVKSEWWHHLEQNGRIWWALSNVIKEGQWRVSAESSMRMMPLRSRGRGGGVVTFWELGRRDYTREKQVGRRREGIL